MFRNIVIYILLIHSGSALAQSKNALAVKPIKLDALEQRLGNGKDTTFVVNFWATWCGPCVEELPYFEKLHAERKNSKVKVLLVSLDFRSKLENAVIPFVQKMGLKAETLLLDERDQQVYIERINKEWSGGIPATLFVNKQLLIKRFVEKAMDYNELVANLEQIK